MPKITLISPAGKTVITAKSGALLSELLLSGGSSLEMPCGGKGRCGKCRVRAEGGLSEITAEEIAALRPEEQSAGIRLACCTRLTGDATVWTEASPKAGQIQAAGIAGSFAKKPFFRNYGAAVDIGTTTLAARLYGKEGLVSSAVSFNPQRVFGADVISRIHAAMEGNAEELARCIREEIARLLTKMAGKARLPVQEIDAMVITGNTAMLHLFAKADPAPLAAAPFQAKELFGKTAEGKDFGLPCHAQAKIYLPRCISAFVGADITTALLASGICDREETALLADIGTNGEMALWHGGRLLCCSTAAGPAFEGAGLSCGMPGVTGAIDQILVKDGKLVVHVIGDVPASGICGSGVVDAAAAIKQLGWMDETGYLRSAEEIILAGEARLTQKDIRMVQLAKSAICAGVQTLLDTAGVEDESLQAFAVAGGFGSYLNLKNAAMIGLYPPKLESKAIVLGNAALSGAVMLLENADLICRSEQIAQDADTVDLSADPVFMEQYVLCMQF